MAHSVAAVDHEGSASTLEELVTPFAQAIAGDPKKRIVMIERGLTWRRSCSCSTSCAIFSWLSFSRS